MSNVRPLMTLTEIDSAIIDAVGRYPKKVAMIVGLVGKDAETLHGENCFDVVASRIAHLVESGQRRATGDISDWRHSEIDPA